MLPYFIGAGGLELPAWEAVAGAELIYELPDTNDSLNRVVLRQGGGFEACQCVKMTTLPSSAGRKAIEVALPSDWTEDGTLFVSLQSADGGAAVVYALPVVVFPAQGEAARGAVGGGECLSPVYADSPCYVDEEASEDERRSLITPADCAPLYTRPSADGEIRLVFNHPIEL